MSEPSSARKTAPTSAGPTSKSKGPAIRTFGDDGSERRVFEVGDSLRIKMGGLKPATAYEVALLGLRREPMVTATLLTNRGGTIEPVTLWPQMGMDDPSSAATRDLKEAGSRFRWSKPARSLWHGALWN